MTAPSVTPGPDAHRTFRLGLAASAVLAVLAVGALVWSGTVSLEVAAFALLVGFPIYLLYVASALSVWLGFDKDATDLRPVHRDSDGTRSHQRRL